MSPSVKSGERCVICGCEGAQRNHVGGRNHVAWFTMPFCLAHHDQFHELLRNSGINLEYTSDPRERLLRAIDACLLAQWMFGRALHELDAREVRNEQKS